MKRISLVAILIGTIMPFCSVAQTRKVDKVQFFTDTSVIKATINVNISQVFKRKRKKGDASPATFVATLPDGTEVNDQVMLQLRGNSRRQNCHLSPLKVVFNHDSSATMSPLKSLKLVNECFTSKVYEQYLLKEFLIYKIYNLLTDMSYRVRLVNLDYVDSNGKKKPISEYAFFIEDLTDLAKRNKCKEWKKDNVSHESTDRKQMTLVALFQYMIGNTDWGVGVGHNTNLIYHSEDSFAVPLVVPYDFDYAGLINTMYAIPDEKLQLASVKDRMYRGFPRSMEELNEAIGVFKRKKEAIYSLINNFELLNPRSRQDMIDYLDGFFRIVNNDNFIKSEFITGARTR